MGYDWYHFRVRQGEGIFVPMKSVVTAWEICHAEMCKKFEKGNDDDDSKKYDHVCKWIQKRVAKEDETLKIQVVHFTFVFLTFDAMLEVDKIDVRGPYDIENEPINIKMQGMIDAEHTARLTKAARTIVPADSRLILKAGKWMVTSVRNCVMEELKAEDGEKPSSSEGLPKKRSKTDGASSDTKPVNTLPEHPALMDSRFFDVTFKVGKPSTVIGCNKAHLAASNRMFCDMFLGNWQQNTEVVYEEFDPDAFRLVLTFMMVDSSKRLSIMKILENADEDKLTRTLQVSDFMGETRLEAVCREFLVQTKGKDDEKVLEKVSFTGNRGSDSEWACFDFDF